MPHNTGMKLINEPGVRPQIAVFLNESLGGIMAEISWRKGHGGGTMEEESWRRDHMEEESHGIMEGESWRNAGGDHGG
jgi:hypothetical protein